MKKLSNSLILILTLLGCSKSPEVTPSSIEEIAKAINEQSQQVSTAKTISSEVPAIERITDKSNEQSNTRSYDQTFCALINQKNLDNPFELEKYLSRSAQAHRFLPSLKMINESATCTGFKTVVNLNPIQIFEIETPLEMKVYFLVSVDSSHRITNIGVQYGKNLSIEQHFIEMRDGVKIFTVVMHTKGEKRPFIINKTPYLNSSSINHFQQYLQFAEAGYNLMIQANRGSFNSGGDFKWLHVENINDAEDTLNWINKLDTSNQRVLSYGVSYDGFNSLTFAATNHSSLIGSISCSSPATALTDSLTGSQAPTFSYLTYVNERETSQSTGLLHEKAAHLLKEQPTLFADMDTLLFGREIADWRDFVKSIENKDNSYFSQRNLYPALIRTKTPIFHVAGLVNDQDARDTMLTFDHIQKSLGIADRNPHFLYIHGGGHSCGDLLGSEGFKAFQAGDIKRIPRVQHFSLNQSRMVAIENYRGTVDHWIKFPLDFAVNDYFTDAGLIDEKTETMLGEVPGQNNPISTTVANIKLDRDIILNGAGSVDLSVGSFTYGVNLIAAVSVTDRWGKNRRINENGYWGSPYSHRFKEEDFGKSGQIRISLPPDLKFLSKGDTISVVLSFYSPYTFDYLRQERIARYREALGVDFGLLYIYKESPPVLNLPIEIPRKI